MARYRDPEKIILLEKSFRENPKLSVKKGAELLHVGKDIALKVKQFVKKGYVNYASQHPVPKREKQKEQSVCKDKKKKYYVKCLFKEPEHWFWSDSKFYRTCPACCISRDFFAKFDMPIHPVHL